jgi:hypothetical protein
MVFLAGKSPNIRSYTVCIYGSGQPYTSVITQVSCTLKTCSAACTDDCVMMIVFFSHRCHAHSSKQIDHTRPTALRSTDSAVAAAEDICSTPFTILCISTRKLDHPLVAVKGSRKAAAARKFRVCFSSGETCLLLLYSRKMNNAY